MAKTVTVRIDESTYKRIKSAADSERRTISNFMEYATLSYVENSTFVDNDEKDEGHFRGQRARCDTLEGNGRH